MTAETAATKAFLEQDTTWTTVIAGSEGVQRHRFVVMAHSVKLSRVDQNEQAMSVTNIESQNPSLHS
jgi:hypothetical protein